MTVRSVQECLESTDPLSRRHIDFLIDYDEEDDRLDYKLEFSNDQKHWLDITKDIAAFANTFGGFLLFGIRDEPRERVGVTMQVARLLKDTNNLQQKINRYLEPEISSLRSRSYMFDGTRLVCLYVPRSVGLTHMISRNGDMSFPNGKSKTVLHQGTFYVRRSGGNHLGDARDLDSLIERRIEQFQESLMEKVARVIQSPSYSDVLITTSESEDDSVLKYVLTDDVDATPVVGVTFTKPPETFEQEILGWKALNTGREENIPAPSQIWTWYKNRAQIELDTDALLALFKFSLWTGAPAYYWIATLHAPDIRAALMDSVRNRPNNMHVTDMLGVAAFLGKTTYREVYSLLGRYKDKVAPKLRSYPEGGPRSIRTQPTKGRNEAESAFRKKLERELSQIVESNGEPKASKRWRAQTLDEYLYAREDKYEGA